MYLLTGMTPYTAHICERLLRMNKSEARKEALENVVRHKRGGGHVEVPHTVKENGLALTVKVLAEVLKGKTR